MEPNLDVIGKESEPVDRSWDSKDAILYAVGVGAGAIDPVSPDELPYTTENSMNVEQRVLPTFGVIIGGADPDFAAIGEIDMTSLVHGEQAIRLHRPIPVEGTIRNVGRITGIFDKGSGMVITSESTSVLVGTGEMLITNTNSLFIRGAGGGGRGMGWGSVPEWPAERPSRTGT